jgi:transposase
MRWYNAWQESGNKGLDLAEKRGRPPKLSNANLEKLEKELLRGPQAHGWSTDLWTLPRIAKLIEGLTGVGYHPGHVWRLMRKLGWSLQRPTTRARERDEQAVLEWTKVEWPKVKKTRVGKERSSS